MGIGWASILTFSLSRFWQWGILSNFCSYHFWEWKVSKMNGEDEKWSTSACFPVFTLRSVQFKTFSYTKARVLQDRNWASYRYAQFWKHVCSIITRKTAEHSDPEYLKNCQRTHCSKSSFLSKKSTLISQGFGLFSCWQLWFHEKNCQNIFGWKTSENVGVLSRLNFWTKIWLFE